MGQKDMVEKLLEDNPEVFADIFNNCLFNGKKVIDPNDLVETRLKSAYRAVDDKIHEMERDVAKIWKNSVTLALFGIENQTVVDEYMPLRVLAYDGASYRSQLLNTKEERLKKKIPKEIYPVVSLVLYFGKEPWNQPKTLKEVIAKHLDIPEELKSYINDYKIHVVDISSLTEEQIRNFESDFRVVADFFAQARKGSYIPTKYPIKHPDETLKMLSVIADSKDFKKFINSTKSKEGKNMCEVIEKIKEEARAEARAKEKVETTIKNLKSAMKAFNVDLETAMNSLEIPEEEKEIYRNSIN